MFVSGVLEPRGERTSMSLFARKEIPYTQEPPHPRNKDPHTHAHTDTHANAYHLVLPDALLLAPGLLEAEHVVDVVRDALPALLCARGEADHGLGQQPWCNVMVSVFVVVYVLSDKDNSNRDDTVRVACVSKDTYEPTAQSHARR